MRLIVIFSEILTRRIDLFVFSYSALYSCFEPINRSVSFFLIAREKVGLLGGVGGVGAFGIFSPWLYGAAQISCGEDTFESELTGKWYGVLCVELLAFMMRIYNIVFARGELKAANNAAFSEVGLQ